MNPPAAPPLLNPFRLYFYALIIGKHGTKLEVGCCICETRLKLKHVISTQIGDERVVAVGEDPQAHRLVDPIPQFRRAVGPGARARRGMRSGRIYRARCPEAREARTGRLQSSSAATRASRNSSRPHRHGGSLPRFCQTLAKVVEDLS